MFPIFQKATFISGLREVTFKLHMKPKTKEGTGESPAAGEEECGTRVCAPWALSISVWVSGGEAEATARLLGL